MAVVTVAGVTVGRAVFEPGWRWSVDVRMNDDTEAVAGLGDAFVIAPGHDGWVVGDERCVMLDWSGGVDHARSAESA